MCWAPPAPDVRTGQSEGEPGGQSPSLCTGSRGLWWGGCRVAWPHRRGVNRQPREARGMGDPRRFSAHSLHLLQPRAQGLVREMPLTEEPLAPFGPGGPCGEGQGISGVGPFLPGPPL